MVSVPCKGQATLSSRLWISRYNPRVTDVAICQDTCFNACLKAKTAHMFKTRRVGHLTGLHGNSNEFQSLRMDSDDSLCNQGFLGEAVGVAILGHSLNGLSEREALNRNPLSVQPGSSPQCWAR